MPPEIADSDAESDLASPQRPSASPIPENIAVADVPLISTLDENPFASLEFDQFLSPTQRISSALDPRDVIESRSTSSTDRFLQDVAPSGNHTIQSTTKSQGFDGSFEEGLTAESRIGPKRTLSDIEGFQTRPRLNHEAEHNLLKRSKTYATARSRRTTSSPLFSDIIAPDHVQNEHATQQYAFSEHEAFSAELPVQPLINPESAERSRSEISHHSTNRFESYRQQGPNTFQESNLLNSFVTKSMAGGYNGINMDFRGAGIGLDASANPFGGSSQISIDGDVNGSQIEKFASLFHHSQPASQDELAEDANDSAIPIQLGHSDEVAPVLQHDSGGTVEKHDKMQRVEELQSKRRKQSHKSRDAQESTASAVQDADLFQQPQSEDPLDLLQEQCQLQSRRSRADTVNSVNSHVSQVSHTKDSSRRKRKRSTAPVADDGEKGKQLSSDLNLSDPAMIGVPREMYQPRPSKSRAKRTEDFDGDKLQTEGIVAVSSAVEEASSLDPSSTVTRKKPGKKNKVKRAKTSAAALLKSSEMYDEDDKDCIILDEVPVKIRMDPLPEISSVKRELNEDIETSESTNRRTADDIVQVDGTSTEAKISIDIPKLADIEAGTIKAKPEPKKRGRKPKKKPDAPTIVEASNDIETEVKQPAEKNNETPKPTTEPTRYRPALAEQDPNISTSAPSPVEPPTDLTLPSKPQPTTSPSPTKQVHSPLKPSTNSSSSRSSTPSTVGIFWTKPRVGLSRRTAIPSLLRKLDRTKEPPRLTERKEKLSKRQQEEEERRRLEAEDTGEAYIDRWEVRGKDGMLLEWDE